MFQEDDKGFQNTLNMMSSFCPEGVSGAFLSPRGHVDRKFLKEQLSSGTSFLADWSGKMLIQDFHLPMNSSGGIKIIFDKCSPIKVTQVL